MTCVALLAALLIQTTPAAYRCPAAEAESERFDRLLEEPFYDSICIDPKPGLKATTKIKGKFKVVAPKSMDTAANLKWRDLTIAFARGDLSPADWLAKTKGLGETWNFLTSPKTKSLRDTMASVPVPPGGAFSSRSVFAELFLLALPGKPCIYSTDSYTTREWPDSPKFESWILAMNDYLGPMLSYRVDHPAIATGKIKVLRADKNPGLFIFQVDDKKATLTYYLNNSRKPIDLPPIDLDLVTINRGLDVQDTKNVLLDTGFVIVHKDKAQAVSSSSERWSSDFHGDSCGGQGRPSPDAS